MKISQTVALIAASLWVSATALPALGAPQWSCLEPVLAEELQGKLDFQDAWAQSISAAQPDLTDFADLAAMTAKLSFQVSRAKVLWLWNTDPDRFDHRDAFFVYSLDDAEMANWLAASAENANRQSELDELKEQLRGHPDAENYGTFLSANVRESPFLELAEGFGVENAARRNRLEACFL